MKPIVFVHGYSAEGKNKTVEQIYGTLPGDLRKEFGASMVLDLNLSRWISLNDGIALDDISFAMDRALNSDQFKELKASGFQVVIHSTGALVVRNWVRLFSEKPSPIENFVHLAGANFGSGLAHIGKGILARWSRQIFQGVDPGAKVLDELEFGSTKTLDLHLHFLQPGSEMVEDYGVREFCMIGSQTLDGLRLVPIRYVKEDSADNTVRTSSCNLNFNYITVKPTAEASSLAIAKVDEEMEKRLADERVSSQWYNFDMSCLSNKRPTVPFAVLYDTAHFGKDLGIVNGKKTRKKVLPLLVEALSFTDDGSHDKIVERWDTVTKQTLRSASRLKGTVTDWNRKKQYEGHSQLIFRLRDQYGEDVVDHDIRIKSVGAKGEYKLETMIEDVHCNRGHGGTKTFYLRTQKFENGELCDLLETVLSLDIEISGYEGSSKDIKYLPLRVRVSAKNVGRMIQPFRTTLIDVVLLRLPGEEVFWLESEIPQQ